MLDAFIDVKKVTKSHIPVVNVPFCIDVLTGQNASIEANESRTRQKHNRYLGSKYKNPKKRNEQIRKFGTNFIPKKGMTMTINQMDKINIKDT